MAKVAWIGLGVMGYPMAGHVLRAGGHDVVVCNRSRAKAEAWVGKHGAGRVATTPAEAAEGADIVLCCVRNDDDVREVTTGKDGAFQSLAAGAVFVDHTTASAEVARELHKTAHDQGFAFLDAPVSGGQSGAKNGTLTVMVGGDEAPFARAKPVILHYARAANLIGASGSGQLTKMVNQIAIAGLLQGLSEAINFAQRSGLDLELVMDTISKGAAQSWQLENQWRTMNDGRFGFGFAVDLMRKDLAICLEEARRNGAALPVTTLVDEFYADVQNMGGSRWDTSSLI
ncbi:MAG: NAD(P)-dependent oxidoreductase, partial [Hyphomicrobiaceae bacterium]|nr:NAD(P)-dependent oxidoreductase [Hyphomicrobiaceae bacterium]